MSNREECLNKAKEAIRGREILDNKDEDSFATIGNFWSLYLKELNFNPETDILSSFQTSQMLLLFKVSRAISGYNIIDTLVDEAGYAAIGYDLVKKEGQPLCKFCSHEDFNPKSKNMCCDLHCKDYMLKGLKDCLHFEEY